MLKRNQTTILPQIVCKFLHYSQVILKSMRVADDTFYGISECEWVNRGVDIPHWLEAIISGGTFSLHGSKLLQLILEIFTSPTDHLGMYSVYSLESTEVLTQPSSPSRHCTYRNHFNPPGDIPEQLAAYSAHTLSTALFMLGTHFAAG